MRVATSAGSNFNLEPTRTVVSGPIVNPLVKGFFMAARDNADIHRRT
jgi:hypothetical protein